MGLEVEIGMQPKQHYLYYLINPAEAEENRTFNPVLYRVARQLGQVFDHSRPSKATWIGYGGSRGGAKSGGIQRAALRNRLRYANTRCAIVRRTYDLVRENHIEKMLQTWPWLSRYHHVQDREFRLPNGSVIAFRYAETEKDVRGQIGKEYMETYVDQAEEFTETELNIWKSVTRWPGLPDSRCKLVLTFNPGGPGHAFLARIFHKRDYTDVERASAELSGVSCEDNYAFVQAYGWDNIEWARSSLKADGITEKTYYWDWSDEKRFEYYISRTQQGRELNALPEGLRLGWLLGHMDQFAGQYYDCWSEGKFVTDVRPAMWQDISIGIDWGFDHDSCAYWVAPVAVADDRVKTAPERAWEAACKLESPNGQRTMFAFYREFVGRGRSAGALAQEVVDRTPVEERARVMSIGLSHDAFAKRDEQDTNAQKMTKVFQSYDMPSPSPAGRDLAGLATMIYELMRGAILETGADGKPQYGPPGLVIDRSCGALLRVIPMIKRKDDDRWSTVKFDGDDAFDAAKHALQVRGMIQSKPAEMAVAEQASKITDPTARWFYLMLNRPKPQPARISPRYGWLQ